MVDTGFSPPTPQPNTPWYKSKSGELFLIILGIFFLAVIAFLTLFGYYFWKITYGGNPSDLAKTFENNTFSPTGISAKNTSTTVDIDIHTLIRANNPTLGRSDAPVTILAFIDFECPFCQKSFPLFDTVMKKYAPTIRVVFKQTPIASLHPHSQDAALASACAHAQGKFWEYYRALFMTKVLDQEALLATADALKLNLTTFQQCLEAQTFLPDITQDLQDAATIGVQGTPTYIVNQHKIDGVITVDAWDTLILQALRKQ